MPRTVSSLETGQRRFDHSSGTIMQWGGGCENHGVVFFMQKGRIAGFDDQGLENPETLAAIMLHFACTAIEKRGSSGCKHY